MSALHSTGFRTARPLTWGMLALLAACTGSPDAKDAAGETGGDTQAADGKGLPEGTSTWTGTMEVGGFPFLLAFTLENTGGDLVAEATFEDDPDAPAGIGSATYQLTGTHDPTNGLLALAPDRWVGEPRDDLELLGATATYDPDTRTLTGRIVDYASGDDNSLAGGPLTATLASGDGEPTRIGDLGRALEVGSRTFSGTMRCTSAEREVEGAFEYDGAGGLVGSMTIGDPGLDTPLGKFEFTGVHNPTTGGITLVPDLWIRPTHTLVTFFVDGLHDPGSGAFTGDQRTNTDACPDDTWSVVIR